MLLSQNRFLRAARLDDTDAAAVQRVPQVSGCSGKTRRHPARCQMRRVLLVDLQELIAGGRKLVLIGARCEGQRRSSKLEVAKRARCESGCAPDVQHVTSRGALREVEQQQTTFSGGRQQKQFFVEKPATQFATRPQDRASCVTL
jgi:hypothetical protein